MAQNKEPDQTPNPDPSNATSAGYETGRVGSSGRLPVAVSFEPREPSVDDSREVWEAIRLHTQQIEFNAFAEFIERAFCGDTKLPPLGKLQKGAFDRLAAGRTLDRYGSASCDVLNPFGGYIPGVDLYALLKLAAEIFLLLRCGICKVTGATEDADTAGGVAAKIPNRFDISGGGPVDAAEIARLEGVLSSFLGSDRASYVRAIIQNVFGNAGFRLSPFCPVSIGFGPCLLELIWSYWHEEAMLVQTANAIALRFQNVSRNGHDPLAELELDVLRPLSGFIWGYIQDEPSRLSVARRDYEYYHHYGFGLFGRARVRPADSRSKFLQAFHDLLGLTAQFYQEGTDNTVTPDPFPLLIALRDLHLILAEGAHNQFRDLPWTARAEMLVQQWLLSRQETRDFLRGRLMVPYPEGWMGAVDAMKRLQGWSDTNVIHFNELARFGERILLSIRHVTWDRIADPVFAQDWALTWKPEIQGYIHAYRMVTGVSLTGDIVEVSNLSTPRYAPPSLLLRNRLAEQRRPALPAGQPMERLTLPVRGRSFRRDS